MQLVVDIAGYFPPEDGRETQQKCVAEYMKSRIRNEKYSCLHGVILLV
jgi:hypothetical protein